MVREAREVQVRLTRGSSSTADTILDWKREGEEVTAGLGVTSSSTGAILDTGLAMEGAAGRKNCTEQISPKKCFLNQGSRTTQADSLRCIWFRDFIRKLSGFCNRLINRPGVAGSVLQTPLSFIN